jgi:hypothetical protein
LHDGGRQRGAIEEFDLGHRAISVASGRIQTNGLVFYKCRPATLFDTLVKFDLMSFAGRRIDSGSLPFP